MSNQITVEQAKAILDKAGYQVRGSAKRETGTIGRKGTSVYIFGHGQMFISKLNGTHLEILDKAGFKLEDLVQKANMVKQAYNRGR